MTAMRSGFIFGLALLATLATGAATERTVLLPTSSWDRGDPPINNRLAAGQRGLQLVQLKDTSRLPTEPAAAPPSELKSIPWYPTSPLKETPDTPFEGWERVPPRMACEEAIHWAAAIQGYLKSKLHVTVLQRQMWESLDIASEPALDKQRELCRQLPEANSPMEPKERQELANRMLEARADYFQRTAEFRRALIDSLSAEQREILNAPPFSTVDALQ